MNQQDTAQSVPSSYPKDQQNSFLEEKLTLSGQALWSSGSDPLTGTVPCLEVLTCSLFCSRLPRCSHPLFSSPLAMDHGSAFFAALPSLS